MASKKKMTKVVSAKELSRTTSNERRGTISWALVGWACKLECGHTVKRSASGRSSLLEEMRQAHDRRRSRRQGENAHG